MKIAGKKVFGSYVETVVLPRPDGNLVFKAKAITSFDAFEQLCPEPKPPVIVYAGTNKEVANIEDPGYLKQFNDWHEFKTHWMILESLKATDDLQWDTVDAGDHTTWKNYSDEMTAAGITFAEQGRIVEIVSIANGLDQSKIDEATESFLAEQAAQVRSANSQDSVPSATVSGAPANAST